MGSNGFSLNGRRWIGAGLPALVVAEIGQNHNGDPERALELIDAAAWAGADAVKVVKRDLDWELNQAAAERPYSSVHSFGATYGAHRRALELAPEVHERLRDRAREHGLLFIATVCDPPSLNTMLRLGIDALKIASRDLTNLPLLAEAARSGLPLFVSTGMSGLSEVDAALSVMRGATAGQCDRRLLLMHCTSLYPTPPADVHLRSMATLADRYGLPVGFSDHSEGTLLAPVAVALGAAAIEKHLTFDRSAKGTDHACSLEPAALFELVSHIRTVEEARGRADKPVPDAVLPVRQKLARSVVARVGLPAGTRLREEMLTLKSPGEGLSWLERHRLLGHRLRRDIAADELLLPVDVEDVEIVPEAI